MMAGCISPSFFSRKLLGKSRFKQFGCNKQLVVLTVDALTRDHCIAEMQKFCGADSALAVAILL